MFCKHKSNFLRIRYCLMPDSKYLFHVGKYLFHVGLLSALGIAFVYLQHDHNLTKKLKLFTVISPQFSSLKVVEGANSVIFDENSSMCLMLGCTISLICLYCLLRVLQTKRDQLNAEQGIENLNERFIVSEYIKNELTKQCLNKIEEVPHYNNLLDGLVAANNYGVSKSDRDTTLTSDETSSEDLHLDMKNRLKLSEKQ